MIYIFIFNFNNEMYRLVLNNFLFYFHDMFIYSKI